LKIAQIGIAIVIILEHSFFIWDLNPSHSTQPVETAITTYMKSPQCQIVQDEVKNAFKDQKNLKESLVQIALENLLSKDNIAT